MKLYCYVVSTCLVFASLAEAKKLSEIEIISIGQGSSTSRKVSLEIQDQDQNRQISPRSLDSQTPRFTNVPRFIYDPGAISSEQSAASIRRGTIDGTLQMGAGSSGGGDICVDRDKGIHSNFASARMLDFAEHLPNQKARINPYFLDESFIAPNIDMVDRVCEQLELESDGATCTAVKNKMTEIYSHSHYLGEILVSKFSNSKWKFVPKVIELVDEGKIKNCKKTLQLAIRQQLTDINDENQSNGEMVVEVSEIFKALNVETQVALIFHEIVYALVAQNAGDQESEKSRAFTASLFSNSKMSEAVQHLSNEIRGQMVIQPTPNLLDKEKIENIVKFAVIEGCLINGKYSNYTTIVNQYYSSISDFKSVCSGFVGSNQNLKKVAAIISNEISVYGKTLDLSIEDLTGLLKEKGKNSIDSISLK